MVQGPDFCRDMHAAEEPAVDSLLQDVFGTKAEVARVRALRKSGAIVGEMVLPFDGGIGGYCAMSQLVSPRGWIALGPVVIAPHLQGKGNGRRMVGLITEWAKITKTPMVVVGPAGFFEKAGFSLAKAQGLETPFDHDDTLIAGIDASPIETLVYPKAFKGN